MMKRILNVLLCSILIGCGGGGGAGGSSPGDAVKKYVKALCDSDTKSALECIDPAKRANAEQPVRMGAQIASAFANSEGGLASVTILGEETEGDHALVRYQTKTKQGGERADVARAEKINGAWYVAP